MTPSIVGQSLPRVDALEKVTGRARYTGDLLVPGMVHAVVVRSTHAHALLQHIDVTKARRTPGILAVFTRDDLQGFHPYYGPAYKDRPVVAIDRVRHEGEPIAAVVAMDRSAAQAGADGVEIDYEALPAAMTLEDALAPGATCVHEQMQAAGHFKDLAALRPQAGTNIFHHFEYGRGDIDAAFRAADLTLEGIYTFPKVQHYALEPHIAIAQWDHD